MDYTEEQFQAVLDERKEIVERIGSENIALRQHNYALKAELKCARDAIAEAYQKAAKIDHELSRLRIAVDSLACDLNPRKDEDMNHAFGAPKGLQLPS